LLASSDGEFCLFSLPLSTYERFERKENFQATFSLDVTFTDGKLFH
jgi:hypothetical protein